LKNSATRTLELREAVNNLGVGFAANIENVTMFKSALGQVADGADRVGISSRRAEDGVHGFVNGLHAIHSGVFLARAALDGLAETLGKPMMEMQHQTTFMRMLGLPKDQIRQMQDAAANTHKMVPAISQAESLGDIQDIFTITRNAKEAVSLAPDIARMKVILGAAQKNGQVKGDTDSMGQSVIKGAEQLGRINNIEQIRQYVELATRNVIASHGQVQPAAIAQAIKYSRGAAVGWNDRAISVLASEIQEYSIGGGSGGGSRGVGPKFAALDRMMSAGVMTKTTAQGFLDLNIFNKHMAHFQKLNTATIQTQLSPHLKDRLKYMENPFDWMQNTLKPAIEAQLPKLYHVKRLDQLGLAQQKEAITKILPGLNGMNRQTILDFLSTPSTQRINRYLQGYDATMKPDKAYAAATENVENGIASVQASFENFGNELGKIKPLMDGINYILKDIVKSLDKLTAGGKFLGEGFDQFGKDHPSISSAAIGAMKYAVDYATDSFAQGPMLASVNQKNQIEFAKSVAPLVKNVQTATANAASAVGRLGKNAMAMVPSAPPSGPGVPQGSALYYDPNSNYMPGGPQQHKAPSVDSHWHNIPHATAPIIHVANVNVQANNGHEFGQELMKHLTSMTHQHFETVDTGASNRQAPAIRGAR
jgi:hypothetical protein